MPKVTGKKPIIRFAPATGYAALAEAVRTGQSAGEAIAAQRREISAAIHGLPPVVYCVLTTDGLIKFGHSTNLLNRLHAYGIGVGNARRLLMVKPGTLVDEQVIHERFAAHAAHGREYFHPAREIIDYLNEERERMGVPALAW